MGVYAENINRENMGRYHVNQVRGVGVTQVVKDSPAEKAGLRKDDVILRIDGENVNSVRKLNRLVSEMAPDHSVRVTVSRGGAEQEVTATIGKRNNSSLAQDLLKGEPRVWKWEGTDPKPSSLKAHSSTERLPDNGDLTFFLSNSRRIGVSTMALTKQLADYFGVADGKGVLVTSVTEDGPAAKAGVKAGDVITAIDGEAVDSPGDLSRVINRKKEGDDHADRHSQQGATNDSRNTEGRRWIFGNDGPAADWTSHRDSANRDSDDSRDRHSDAANRDSVHSVDQHQSAARACDAASESQRLSKVRSKSD